jgi:hypothetical protein
MYEVQKIIYTRIKYEKWVQLIKNKVRIYMQLQYVYFIYKNVLTIFFLRK